MAGVISHDTDQPMDTVKARLPVRRAFSELFVDTELGEKDYFLIAKVCIESPYTAKELESILFNEVWPALRINLFSMAGNWSGWTDEFLKSNISPIGKFRICLPWWLNPAKRYFLKDAWNRILSEINNQIL